MGSNPTAATNFMTPSITNQPIFQPPTNREVYMEDIIRMKLALFREMAALKITMQVKDEDKFNDSFSLFLEESFNWPDFKNHN